MSWLEFMKIYFTAAITNIPSEHQESYKKIVKELEALGYKVTADHILDKTVEKLAKQSEEEAKTLYRKMMVWKHQSALIVVEGSYPSFGVGQEITYALSNKKPVIVLHLKGRKPHILTGLEAEYLYIVEYDQQNLKKTLLEYIDYAKETADTRYNFFISPEIDSFLDWVSKKRKLPRAVFLRQLIEEDMKNNKRYLKKIGKEK